MKRTSGRAVALHGREQRPAVGERADHRQRQDPAEYVEAAPHSRDEADRREQVDHPDRDGERRARRDPCRRPIAHVEPQEEDVQDQYLPAHQVARLGREDDGRDDDLGGQDHEHHDRARLVDRVGKDLLEVHRERDEQQAGDGRVGRADHDVEVLPRGRIVAGVHVLPGSYRIATAPEAYSSRLTSVRSTCFDSPANNVGPRPASLGCTTNSYSSINPSSVNACGSITPPVNSPFPDSRLSCRTASPRSPRTSSAFQSTCCRVLDTTYFFAASIVRPKVSIQSGLPTAYA